MKKLEYIMSNRLKVALARREPARQELLEDARWEAASGRNSWETETSRNNSGLFYKITPTGGDTGEESDPLKAEAILFVKRLKRENAKYREWEHAFVKDLLSWGRRSKLSQWPRTKSILDELELSFR